MSNFSITAADGLEKIIISWKKSTSKGYKNYTADVFSIYYDDIYYDDEDKSRKDCDKK